MGNFQRILNEEEGEPNAEITINGNKVLSETG